MKTYELFVHDDRYSVPTLHLITVADATIAQLTAEALLRANAHHLGVELCCEGEQILVLGDCAERRPGPFEAEALKAAAGG
jgi:hypothetical protein